jgi:hypothetical protein
MDLECEVLSTWDSWVSGLQECKGNGFQSRAAGGHKFPVISMKTIILFGGLTLPESTSPEKFVGGV